MIIHNSMSQIMTKIIVEPKDTNEVILKSFKRDEKGNHDITNPTVILKVASSLDGRMHITFEFPQVVDSIDRKECRNVIIAESDGEIVAQTCIAEGIQR